MAKRNPQFRNIDNATINYVKVNVKGDNNKAANINLNTNPVKHESKEDYIKRLTKIIQYQNLIIKNFIISFKDFEEI